MKNQKHNISTVLITISAAIILSIGSGEAREPAIPELKSLALHKNPLLKEFRKDIRQSVFIVRGRREADKLPRLRFCRYRVKSGDTFWKILSRSNLDIDTIMTVNDLSNPGQVSKGKVLFLPNMRGVLMPNKGKKNSHLRLRRAVPDRYIVRANGKNSENKKFIFLPCGKISRLQRSLFLGTGFMSPVKHGRKTSGFGTRKDPFRSRRYQFHRGIDLACPIGTPIRAARNGRVSFKGYRGGYGRLVVIKHEHSYQTMYGHLSRYRVRPGDYVKAGDIIAYSGNTGRTTGPHLHFEVRRGNRAVNPGHLMR